MTLPLPPEGRILVNGRALRFRCERIARVFLWMELPDGSWLTRAALREIRDAAAQRHG